MESGSVDLAVEHFPILPSGQPRFVIGVAVPELGETEAKQRWRQSIVARFNRVNGLSKFGYFNARR